jgi:hypothetical protein
MRSCRGVNLVAIVAYSFQEWLIRVESIEDCPKIGEC